MNRTSACITVFIAGSIKIKHLDRKFKERIEPGDDKHAFGVVVPDLPGCFSAGNSAGDAMAQARGETRSGFLARAALETMARD